MISPYDLWFRIPTTCRYTIEGERYVQVDRRRGLISLTKVTEKDVEQLIAKYGSPSPPKGKQPK